jgi:hypothetical protein
LPFSPEPSVFRSAVKKSKNENIQDYNFACGYVWVRPRCRWVDNIKMDLSEIGWGGVDWVGLAQERDKWRALVNVVMNLRVP